MPITHNQPSDGVYLRPCQGQFQWALVRERFSKATQVRRECPVCGCREKVEKGVWTGVAPNPFPGRPNGFLRYLVEPKEGW